jgi:uncharacterized RDD family membrane protein YckC
VSNQPPEGPDPGWGQIPPEDRPDWGRQPPPPPPGGWSQPGGGAPTPPGQWGQQPPEAPWGQPPPPPAGQWGQQPPPGYPPQGYPGAGYGPPTGPTDPWGRPLADWWRRLVAIIVDGFVVGIPLSILSWIFGIGGGGEIAVDEVTGEVTGLGEALAGTTASSLLSMVVVLAYMAVLNGGERGQTVGKMVLKIQVRSAETGGPLGVGPAALRAIVYNVLFYLCLIPGFINGLSPLWDARRQAWHDKAVKSVVISVPG